MRSLSLLQKIVVTAIISVWGVLLSIPPTYATEDSVTNPLPITTPKLNIPIPTLPKLSDVPPVTDGGQVVIPWVGEYFAAAYQYFVGIAIIVAIIMMMVGGLQWSASAGSSERIGAARSKITNGLMGMFLALGSYLILYTINPDLVKFKALVIPSISRVEIDEDITEQHANVDENTVFDAKSGSAEEQSNKVKIQNCQSAAPSQKFTGSLTASKLKYNYLGKLDCSGVKGVRDLKAKNGKGGVTTVVLHEGGSTTGIIAWWNSQCAKIGKCYGTHFNIEPDGTIQQIAGIDKYVSHGNNTNSYSIGIDLDINIKSSVLTVICINQAKKDGFSKQDAQEKCTAQYTTAQMQSIANLIKDLSNVTEIKLAPNNIIPHCLVESGTHADPRGFDFAKLGNMLGITMSNEEVGNRSSKAKKSCHLLEKHIKEVNQYLEKAYK